MWIKINCSNTGRFKHRPLMVFGKRTEQVEKHNNSNTLVGRIKHWRRYMTVKFSITDNQIQSLGPITTLLDVKGNPITLPPGAVCVWQCDTPAVFSLTPSADTFTCAATAVGPLTNPNSLPVITLTINDSGGNPIAAGTVQGEVTTSAPVSLDIPLGPVTEQA